MKFVAVVMPIFSSDIVGIVLVINLLLLLFKFVVLLLLLLKLVRLLILLLLLLILQILCRFLLFFEHLGEFYGGGLLGEQLAWPYLLFFFDFSFEFFL